MRFLYILNSLLLRYETNSLCVTRSTLNTMHISKLILFLTTGLLGIILLPGWAQENKTPTKNNTLQLILPVESGWNTFREGDTARFTLQAKENGALTDSVRFSIAKGKRPGMNMDSTGKFSWKIPFDIADRINLTDGVPLLIEVENAKGDTDSQQVILKIIHVNRPPEVDELKTFYVQYKTQNTYQIDANAVRDPDNDPIVFIPIRDGMPEGMELSAGGIVTWEPSLIQFNLLRNGARYIDFYVEDQPSKVRTKGRIKLEVTQKELAPSITLVPKTTYYKIKENSIINIKIFLADPNGDDDISTFNFISTNRDVPQKALIKNTNTSYEFIWEPTYDFVKDPLDTLAFDITFFVLDKSQNREEKKVRLCVINTINEAERDKYLYDQYKGALVNAWGLLEQMRDKEEQLKRLYRRAKSGKQNRSVVNASLGATTGMAPVIAGPTNTGLRTRITTIGGTTVATIGTLEATEVIGKSMKDLLDRFNYVMEKKSDLQNKGDIFSREYALKANRRKDDFVQKLDAFRAVMNIRGLVALELDANWENKKEATDKVIKQTFKDFTPLDDPQ